MSVKLNYKTFGQGEPLVILHGLFGMLDNWRSFARRLEKDFLVITIDLRNHGKSPRHEVHNYQVMAQDIADFLDSHFLFQAHILGHSMGGKVAMNLALEYSEKVKSLIVADMGVKQYPSGHDHIFQALLSTPIEKANSRNELYDFLKEKLQTESIVQFLMKNVKRNKNSQGYRWKFQLDILYESYKEILSAVKSTHTFSGPVTFVKGGDSDYVNDADLSEIRKFFPKAELVEIPRAGHWIHADAPDATEKFVRAHLNKSMK